MKTTIIIILLYLLWWTGTDALKYQHDLKRQESALLGKAFLFPATDEEKQRFDIKEKELEILHKQRELEQKIKELELMKSDKFSDSLKTKIIAEEAEKLSDKNDEEIIKLYDEYPRGHNPPTNVIKEKISDLKNARNLYFAGFGFFSTSMLAYLFLPKRKGGR